MEWHDPADGAHAGWPEVSRESRAPRFRGTAGFRCASRVLDQAEPQRIGVSRRAAARAGRHPADRRSSFAVATPLPYSITEYGRRRMELPDARVLHLEPDLEGPQERKRFAGSVARPRREVTRLRGRPCADVAEAIAGALAALEMVTEGYAIAARIDVSVPSSRTSRTLAIRRRRA